MTTGHRELAVIGRASLDPILGIDDDRRLLHANERAGELLGIDPAQIEGLSLDDFCAPGERPRLERIWREFRRCGEHSGPLLLRRADRALAYVRLQLAGDLLPGTHLLSAREIAGGPRRGKSLTRREQEVLQLAADGSAAAEIAAALAVSPATVKTHFQNAYAKLDVRDRAAAVAVALRRGLIR